MEIANYWRYFRFDGNPYVNVYAGMEKVPEKVVNSSLLRVSIYCDVHDCGPKEPMFVYQSQTWYF